jgi:hypothetical protein
MVESSRLGRAGSVCLQQLSSRSNKSSSRLGFATQPPRISLLARDGDARRIVRARSEFHLVTFLLVITGKRSTLFVEIQGPVCVDGLVLRSPNAGQCSSGCVGGTRRAFGGPFLDFSKELTLRNGNWSAAFAWVPAPEH